MRFGPCAKTGDLVLKCPPTLAAPLFSILRAWTTSARSSLLIAEITGKRHDHVIRDIENILGQVGIQAPQFWGAYKTPSGQTSKVYNLPRRECDLLMMTFARSMLEVDDPDSSAAGVAASERPCYSQCSRSASQMNPSACINASVALSLSHQPNETDFHVFSLIS